jgi:hypothetical protein
MRTGLRGNAPVAKLSRERSGFGDENDVLFINSSKDSREPGLLLNAFQKVITRISGTYGRPEHPTPSTL